MRRKLSHPLTNQKSNPASASTISRRSFMQKSAGLVSASAAMSMLSPMSSAFAQGGVLNLMGWADYISPNNIERWEKEFGGTFIYDAYASNDEMFSKLQLSGGNSGYDIGMNTDFMMKLLIDGGYIQKLDKSRIPNIGNIDPAFSGRPFDPNNDYSIPKSWGSQGFMYDKSVVKGEMKTWADFLRAVETDASGDVSLLDDALALAPIFWSQNISWNTTDEAALKHAEEVALKLAPHVRSFSTYPVQDIASGTIKLAQIWSGNARQTINSANNENLVFVYPEPITERALDSYYIPANAPNLDAAYSWLNFVLDPEVAAEEIVYTGFPTAVVGVEKYLPAEIAGDTLTIPPADVVARGEETERNETYDRRVDIFVKLKAAAAAS